MSNLSVKKLQNLVRSLLDEERLVEALRSEFKRALGISFSEIKLHRLAESAVDELDKLENHGKLDRKNFKTSIFVRLLEHDESSVRTLAAKVVPDRFLIKLLNDKSQHVRLEVAKRLPTKLVEKMSRMHPDDDQLYSVCKVKKLMEVGIPQPTPREQHLNLRNKKRLGSAVKQHEGPELSDLWYDEQAKKFMQDYGGNLEDSWEEIAARRYCASIKSSFGIEIDEVKLLKSIKDLINDREERVIKRTALKETLDWLRSQPDDMQIEDFESPSPDRISYESLSHGDLIHAVNETFNIQHVSVDTGLLNESFMSSTMTKLSQLIPIRGTAPRSDLSIEDENVLDAYCEAWNSKQSLVGTNKKVTWSIHPRKHNVILFTVT